MSPTAIWSPLDAVQASYITNADNKLCAVVSAYFHYLRNTFQFVTFSRVDILTEGK